MINCFISFLIYIERWKKKNFTFCNFSHINVSFFVLFSQIIQISQQNLFSLASNTKFLHILKTLNKSWMSLADLSQWWQCCVWFFSQQFVLLAPHLSWVSASVSHKKHSILNNQTQTEQNMSVLSRSNINHSNQLQLYCLCHDITAYCDYQICNDCVYCSKMSRYSTCLQMMNCQCTCL